MPESLSSPSSRLWFTSDHHFGHDKTADRMKESFGWVRDYYELKVEDADAPSGKQRIVLCHYAFRVWRNAHHGSWHLYGHSHGSLPGAGRSMDVGVDCHDFSPISYEQVKAALHQL
ncbi:MAG: hypothetical protein NTX57_00570 [Armatimonadetes bacterium]|nr:hypothetical protein [Armatimonadota bacterium]